MDLNDNGNEWDACISLADKEEEVKRLAVRSQACDFVHCPEPRSHYCTAQALGMRKGDDRL